MATKIVPVEFQGDTLWGFEQSDGVFIALKPMVEAIGLDWSAQYRRVNRDPILKEGIAIMATPLGRGGDQKAICLRLDLINGWLFTIDSNRIKDESIRLRVLDYQRECYGVLSQHFLGLRNEQMFSEESVGSDLGSQTELGNKSRLVEIANRISGPRAACELWHQLGLPTVPSFGPRVADVPAGVVMEAEDQLRSFIEDGCRLDPKHTMTARAMFLAYKDWAHTEGHPIISETAFGRAMLHLSQDYNFLKIKARIVTYRGLRVKEVG
ncbi:phage antirepressor N-terminal domain-containing protein [Pseudovibrio sp. FO-BEG1]|uniref:phage antirepressor N-terminal domain-containing protein n=1 Tax=Pseudovibrio sp. (strain FO-BEG1) TaxID=911045 RepID=UPI0002F5580E|nr:phage antirepressor N-terminal domain-containing protein [Pseudovibrio sp. FO-BEG1]